MNTDKENTSPKFDLDELKTDLIMAYSMIGEIVDGKDEGKSLLEYAIRKLEEGFYLK